MTRMCPSFIEESTPPGERKIFGRLAEIEDEWIVFHSLDVAPSNNNKRTEIDFLVVMPDLGLLCIEVKSHQRISFDGRQWSPPSITRSPFKQAQDARHALIRRFKTVRRISDGGRLPFPVGNVCIFSEAPFDASNQIGINPSELIDAKQLDAMTTWQDFRDKLRSCLLSSLRNEGIRPLAEPLSGDEMLRIAEECSPIRKRKAQSNEELMAAERTLLAKLREQQRPILRLAELNPRLLVTGPAGTGKTLIAVEIAKRLAESGRRVGLFCYNSLLGDWLQEQLAAHPNVVAGTAYKTLSKMTGIVVDQDRLSDSGYWSSDLPEAYLDKMTSSDFTEDYALDVLLVDEAQDLLPRAMLWECLMQLVRDGEQKGTWLVFGDFSNQAITGADDLQAEVKRLKKSTSLAHWELRENCRNLSLIGKTAAYLLGVAGLYDGYMRIGEDPALRKYLPYSDSDSQQVAVENEIAALIAEGFKPNDIVLLSFCAEENSLGCRLEKSGKRFSPVAKPRTGNVGYANINAFKGMERKVVIITDVDRLYDRQHERPRLFVGATRATERLRIALTSEAADLLWS